MSYQLWKCPIKKGLLDSVALGSRIHKAAVWGYLTKF